ncbi:hypothetical protein OC846_002002 [Tilletia horrida]|uniref:Alpha-ketoglutarate-dependent dioxygenase AlkB-like domain-containing protein n=1 Tax=Tilletia horrida TaxID=155126 RepID=A0AAN6GT31_9BASI|nr:hypothetical protein OC846_002002 [Tilletia horrida]
MQSPIKSSIASLGHARLTVPEPQLATSSSSNHAQDQATPTPSDPSSHDASTTAEDREEDESESGGFYYIPDFITEQEERLLLREIYNAPALKWKTLQNRRLQTWGGQLAGKSGDTLIPQPLPSFFVKSVSLVERIAKTGAFEHSKHAAPNHCLVNEYLSGQGIMPHEDGGAYFPAVATISLASHTLLDIYRYADVPEKQSNEGQTAHGADGTADPAPKARAREKDPAFSIFQERRSLLITTGSAYKKYLHGIAERQADGPDNLRSIINLAQLGSSEFKETITRLQQGSSMTPEVSVPTDGAGAEPTTEPQSQTRTDGSDNTEAPQSADAPTAQGAALNDEDDDALGPLLSLTDAPVVTDAGIQRQTRVSLTFRDVEKVSKGLASLLGRGGGKR